MCVRIFEADISVGPFCPQAIGKQCISVASPMANGIADQQIPHTLWQTYRTLEGNRDIDQCWSNTRCLRRLGVDYNRPPSSLQQGGPQQKTLVPLPNHIGYRTESRGHPQYSCSKATAAALP